MRNAAICARAALLALAFPLLVAAGPRESWERVYGWELMTHSERLQHREEMRNAGSAEERARIRSEHHARMLERAKEQGLDLGPNRRMGLQDGFRHGSGMGPGRRSYP